MPFTTGMNELCAIVKITPTNVCRYVYNISLALSLLLCNIVTCKHNFFCYTHNKLTLSKKEHLQIWSQLTHYIHVLVHRYRLECSHQQESRIFFRYTCHFSHKVSRKTWLFDHFQEISINDPLKYYTLS